MLEWVEHGPRMPGSESAFGRDLAGPHRTTVMTLGAGPSVASVERGEVCVRGGIGGHAEDGSMSVRFPNLTGSPEDPVTEWGYEGLLAAVDRGEVAEWVRVADAVYADPYGEVATTLLDQVLDAARDTGVAAALRRTVSDARAELAARERAEVARRVRAAVATSGLSRARFASRVGTSPSRLSTYATGRVTPSASLLLRIEALAGATVAQPAGAAGAAGAVGAPDQQRP